jgi:hypothetical protein
MDTGQIDEEITLAFSVSDEALEAAANADQLSTFSLGHCTDARICQAPN